MAKKLVLLFTAAFAVVAIADLVCGNYMSDTDLLLFVIFSFTGGVLVVAFVDGFVDWLD